MALHADYPLPTYLCNGATATGLQSAILDIGPCLTPRLPPPLQIVITGTATVKIWASCAINTSSTTPTLISPIDVTSGGVTASDFRDLIPGIPFYQVEVFAINPGSSVTVLIGSVPTAINENATPQLVRMTTNATQGM